MQENKLSNLGDDENEIFVPEDMESVVINTAKMAYLALMGYMTIKGADFNPWDKLDDKERNHYIGRAAYFFAYPNDNVDAAHAAWKMRLLLSGFSLGSNTEKKQHPHLKDFQYLPEELQVADAIFKGVVDGVLTSE